MAAAQTVQQKLDAARRLRDGGNDKFKQQDWKGAMMAYHEALNYLTGLDTQGLPIDTANPPEPLTDAQKAQIQQEMISCWNNLSTCLSKEERWERVVFYTSKFSFLQVLAKDPTSVKALFRRGVAYSRLNNLDKAHADLLAAAKANPNDALIRSEYEDVKKRQQAAEAKARSEMAGFMSRAK